MEPPDPGPFPLTSTSEFAEIFPLIVMSPDDTSLIAPPPASELPPDPRSVGCVTDPYGVPPT